MTLGIRIAEQRKKLGLSQEALGERMGVSRQAISKWEADAAVPEIDKLIVLSRIFEVSVGWLLGIDEDPAEKSGGFTDEQLYMVEEIVKRYQQPRQETGRLRRFLFRNGPALTLGASILALCLSVTALRKVPDRQMQELWGELSRLSIGQMQLQSWVEYLEQQTAGEDLFADFTVTARALEDLSGAKVWFAGTPESWDARDTGILSVRREGQEVVRSQCAWNGTVLETEVELPAADGYEYYFLLLRQDGTQEQRNITGGIEDPSVIDIAKGLRFHCDFRYEGSCGRKAGSEFWYMHFRAFNAGIMLPPLFGQEDLTLESADLVLYRSGQEIARYPMELITGSYATNVTRYYPDGTVWVGVEELADAWLDEVLTLDELTEDDFVEAIIEMKLSDGVIYQERVQTWDVSDAP